MSAVSALPSCWHGVEETLPDGSAVVLRPLEPDDAHLLHAIFDRMGPRSRERRFLTPKHRLSAADVRVLTAVDHRDHEAVVALAADDGQPVGVARFVRSEEDPETAEVAVVVVDAWQSRGVGTVLATALVRRAKELRVRRFAVMMAHDNEAALRLLHRVLGDVEHVALDTDTAEFVVGLEPGHRGGRIVLKGA
jgi:RimJ/RimL family protein N-acetyltransferase